MLRHIPTALVEVRRCLQRAGLVSVALPALGAALRLSLFAATPSDDQGVLITPDSQTVTQRSGLFDGLWKTLPAKGIVLFHSGS